MVMEKVHPTGRKRYDGYPPVTGQDVPVTILVRSLPAITTAKKIPAEILLHLHPA
jgi:hypothetical protein